MQQISPSRTFELFFTPRFPFFFIFGMLALAMLSDVLIDL